MEAYAAFLRENTQELDLLFKELLIGVTSFFRDAEAWQALSDIVLPTLLARHAANSGPLRAWVVGCSTGEEAYSLAIAFAEAVDLLPHPTSCQLQIFATDLNADAIAAARSGRFAATIARDLAPERLARFFSERPDGYQIDKRIRDMVLFAQHDVILDPPFTRLDILSCRNLMIYFSAGLQRRLVPLFHYSLRPGGALLLGGSETHRPRPVAVRSRVAEVAALLAQRQYGFRRCARLSDPPARGIALDRAGGPSVPPEHSPGQSANRWPISCCCRRFRRRRCWSTDGGDIVYISGHTGRYLEPAAGKANWNIHVMARPAIRAQLARCLADRLAGKDRGRAAWPAAR